MVLLTRSDSVTSEVEKTFFEIWITNLVNGSHFYDSAIVDLDGTIGDKAFVGFNMNGHWGLNSIELLEWSFKDHTNQNLASGSPQKIAILDSESVSDSRIDLFLENAGDTETYYDVHYRVKSSDEEWKHVSKGFEPGTKDHAAVKVEGLLADTEYEFYSTARNTLGTSDASELAYAKTLTEGAGTQHGFLAKNLVIPGIFYPSQFDIGGNGVAYHDTSLGNNGIHRASEDVDFMSNYGMTHGRAPIGGTQNGEWIEWTTDVKKGTYDLHLFYRIDTHRNYKPVSANLYLNDEKIVTVHLDESAGLQKAIVSGIELYDANDAILKFEFEQTNGGSGGFLLDRLNFIPTVDVDPTIPAPRIIAAHPGEIIPKHGRYLCSHYVYFDSTAGNIQEYEVRIPTNPIRPEWCHNLAFSKAPPLRPSRSG